MSSYRDNYRNNPDSGLSALQKDILRWLLRAYSTQMEHAAKEVEYIERLKVEGEPLPGIVSPFMPKTIAEWRDRLDRGGVAWNPKDVVGCKKWEWSATKRADLSRALRRLEERGLVERRMSTLRTFLGLHTKKARTQYVKLTPAGLEIAKRLT